jgi:NAD(P)-dependent dehydrogenase (short-subunit alcohol dehydrogenase family)
VELDRPSLYEAFGDIGEASDHLLIGGVDLAEPEAAGRMVEAAHDRFGRIDILVNTVGGCRAGKPVHEDDPETWDFLFDLNVRTAVNACRGVIPHMLRQGHGRIINVGSRNALLGGAKASAYSAAQTAVLRLTESLSAEVKESDINVNCVLPGTLDTPENRAAMPDADRSKWVDPAAVADVITFLASDTSRSIHGAAIPAYGRS